MVIYPLLCSSEREREREEAGEGGGETDRGVLLLRAKHSLLLVLFPAVTVKSCEI